MEERGLFAAGFLLVVAFIIVVAAIGEPIWIVPAAVFGVLLLVALGISRAMQARAERTGADSDEPLPLTSAAPSGGDLGDDPEAAPDEISPHDLPVDHPGRHASEVESDDRFTRTHPGATRGNVDSPRD